MSINIDVCNDVENYQESVIMGFTAKQVIWIIVILLAGAAQILLLYFVAGVSILAAAYMSMPLCIALGAKGFMNKKISTINFRGNKVLTYQSSEAKEFYQSAGKDTA